MGLINYRYEAKYKKAKKCIDAISELLEEYYGSESREELITQVKLLKEKNHDLEHELYKYKKVFDSVILLQSDNKDVHMCSFCEYFEDYSTYNDDGSIDGEYDCSKIGLDMPQYYEAPHIFNECEYFSIKL
jgi:hypothetical protein